MGFGSVMKGGGGETEENTIMALKISLVCKPNHLLISLGEARVLWFHYKLSKKSCF